MNIVNKITMEYLADRNYSHNSDETDPVKYSINDLKFYKKRIINLLKERITTKSHKSHDGNLDDVDKILDRFFKSCINKFKIEDYHELKQAELSVFNEDNAKDISLDDITDNTIYKNLEECNQLLYAASEEKKVTLDNFVIKSNGSLVKKPKEYPQLNKINLRDKKLKYKGLKAEKSN